jgi:hypothetical protein
MGDPGRLREAWNLVARLRASRAHVSPGPWSAVRVDPKTACDPDPHGVILGPRRVPVGRHFEWTPGDATFMARAVDLYDALVGLLGGDESGESRLHPGHSSDFPLVVRGDAVSGPWLLVPLARWGVVEAALRSHGIAYWADEDALSFDDGPLLVTVNFNCSQREQIAVIQGVVDSIPGVGDAGSSGHTDTPAP